jgi:hypothetical protein
VPEHQGRDTAPRTLLSGAKIDLTSPNCPSMDLGITIDVRDSVADTDVVVLALGDGDFDLLGTARPTSLLQKLRPPGVLRVTRWRRPDSSQRTIP